MAKIYQTPGVYIVEKSAFPNSMVPIPTAVPAFVGYTERAERKEKSLLLQPTRISSLGEYETLFGGGPLTMLTIGKAKNPGVAHTLAITKGRFTLHSQLRMFFSNGGSDCYIVSVGGYAKANGTANAIDLNVLKSGIAPLLKETAPTLLIIPEAAHAAVGTDTKAEDVAAICTVYQAMLKHCGVDTKNRFAITDAWMDVETFEQPEYDLAADIERFRDGIGANSRQWGAAYFPWLHTTAVGASDVSLRNIANRGVITDVKLFPNGTFDENGNIVDRAKFQADFLAEDAYSLAAVLDRSLNQDVFSGTVKAARAKEIKTALLTELTSIDLVDSTAVDTLNGALLAVSPTFEAILREARKQLNLLPPSAAMAGIYSMIDAQRGVFKAPANVNIGSVLSPAVSISNEQQQDLNAPALGKAVNAIRNFPGQGVLVWGARTLDSNSLDWRYINVRRMVIYIEQSIKAALMPFVSEPNVATTWQTVKAMLSSFLTNEWKLGALAGASPDDAFRVDVGLGSTMTNIDILDGYLRVQVAVAIVRPAEFIVITFEQKMKEA